MTAANELIRKAVMVDATRRPAEHDPRPDPLGPPTSLVLRSSLTPAPASPSPEAIVFALADGFAYASTARPAPPCGRFRWAWPRRSCPASCRARRRRSPSTPDHDELIRLDATTGALIWRLALGELAGDPPLVLGNQLAQVLPERKLLFDRARVGRAPGDRQPGPAAGSDAGHDESGQHLYVLGRQDCLFVLNRDPLGCAAVVYLGHAGRLDPCRPACWAGSWSSPRTTRWPTAAGMSWSSTRTGRRSSRCRTSRSPAGPGRRPRPRARSSGRPATRGATRRSRWATMPARRRSDRSRGSRPIAAVGAGVRVGAVGSGAVGGVRPFGRFELDAEHGKITAKASLAQPGPALAPIQNAGRLVVMTFQDQETSGVALWGIDSDTGLIAWKTIVAAPWSTPLGASVGSNDLVMLGRDGREVRITPEQIARGGFIGQAIPRPGDFALPAGLRLRLEVDGKPLAVIAPLERSNVLWVEGPAAPDRGTRSGSRPRRPRTRSPGGVEF